jgi:hypothetical protein
MTYYDFLQKYLSITSMTCLRVAQTVALECDPPTPPQHFSKHAVGIVLIGFYINGREFVL